VNPFLELPFFRETRDGRHVVALNIYPKSGARALSFLRCGVSVESLNNAILQWKADDLENAASEAGLVFAKVRTFKEYRKEAQYTEVLSKMSLISVEKIGESEPIPFKKDGKSPLDGIRAFGMGHVIAGAGIGRDRADVLNIWRPDDTEVDGLAWDAQVGGNYAVLERGWLRTSGFLTWLVWAFVHILALPQLQNRLRVQRQWLWSYFTGQRSSRLIPEPPGALLPRPREMGQGASLLPFHCAPARS